jgi:hypothetical protein
MNNMNFVYICRNGDNEELRYSIRSLYKNINNPDIWIIGGKPIWYSGNYIEVNQNRTKHVNVRNNLNKLITSNNIPNDFILMNDDFFIMKPMSDIPYMHGGNLFDKVKKFKTHAPTSSYTKMLSDTYNVLIKKQIENPLDYAIHVPIKMNKEKLSTVIYPSLSIRTMYGNLYDVGGEEIKDVKVHLDRPWSESFDYNKNINFLSTNDKSFIKLFNDVLKNEFIDKSPLEK